MKLRLSQKVYMAESAIAKAGRGVFAAKAIKSGGIIETCPVIDLPDKDRQQLKDSELYNYYFLWGKEQNHAAIALGFGSLYNHSYDPNATYVKRIDEGLIDFIALKPIKKDEEITVNYNFGNPNDQSPLWIKSIKPPGKK